MFEKTAVPVATLVAACGTVVHRC